MRRELLPLLLFVACQRGPEPEALRPVKRVRCAKVTTLELADEVTLRGTVSALADRDALVAPQIPGRLTRVLVHEGDVVASGQLLASVDDGPLVDAAHQAEASLARARAEHDNTRSTLDRVRRVFERGIAARQEVDDAATKVAAARAGEAEADVALHVAQRQLSRAQVRSPLAGVVVKILRRPGELVDGTPATPVLEVADLSRLELVADVAARELVRLSAGQRGQVSFSFLPLPFAASVTRVSPSVDRVTGIGTVRVEFERPDAGSPPLGALGLVNVSTGQRHTAIVVPTVSLRRGSAEVVACVDGLARVVPVHAGPMAGDGGSIVDGVLSAGTLVAIDPVVGLEDGDVLEVSP